MSPRSPHRRLAAEDGFSIVEVLVAAVVLVVGLLGTLTLVDTATTATFETKSREQATALQRELIEAVRAVPYDQLTPASLAGAVQGRDALSDAGVSAGWTVRRRDTTYTVAISSCVVDDPRDGTGAGEAGVACDPATAGRPASGCQGLLDGTPSATALAKTTGAAGTAAQRGACGIDSDLNGVVDGLVSAGALGCGAGGCTDDMPADYKRVTSLVRWEAGAVRRSVLQVTTIPNPGLSAAPAVTSLEPSPATDSIVTSGTATGVSFTAQANPIPASVVWYVDGAFEGNATGSGANWSFRWDFGAATLADGQRPAAGELLDGSYVVAAKAFDKYDQYGASRSRTILVNRRRPFAPLGLIAGRNGGAVDLEWLPSPERDVTGYRVYRVPAAGDPVLACAVAQVSRCRDLGAPAAGEVSYFVLALDRESDAVPVREGDRSPVRTAAATNDPPPPPPSLQATVSGGDVVLAWSQPQTPAGSPVVPISHYNIYRDGRAYEARYDRTGSGTELSYVDTRAGSEPHTYFITSVGTNLAESEMVGAVSAGG